MCIRLLRHPIPYKNESLANYFVRLSYENSCKIAWLKTEFEMQGRKGISFLNFIYSENKIKQIAHTLDMTAYDVINMTINKFSLGMWGMHYEAFRFNSNLNYIKYVTMEYSKFCPICLCESSHQRIFWHIKPITVCIKHKVYLLEKCLSCGKDITSEEVISGICNCGEILKNFKPANCTQSSIVKKQKEIYNIFDIAEKKTLQKRNCLFMKNFGIMGYIDKLYEECTILIENSKTY
jgi:hypothetical protein